MPAAIDVSKCTETETAVIEVYSPESTPKLGRQAAKHNFDVGLIDVVDPLRLRRSDGKTNASHS